MDHIPAPENPRYPPLTIPYICQGSYSSRVGDTGFAGYPALRGMNISSDDLTTEDAEAFLQEWIFFGLVSEVAGAANIEFDEAEFVTEWPPVKGKTTLTTRGLEKFLSSYISATQDKSDSEIAARVEKISAVVKLAREALLTYIAALRVKHGGSESLEPFKLFICLAVLAEEISSCLASRKENGATVLRRKDIAVYVETAVVFDVGSIPVLASRTVSNFYCPLDEAVLWAPVSFGYYVSMLPDVQSPSKDHSKCTKSYCVADQVDTSTYKTLHIPGCSGEDSCQFIGFDTERMFEIIEADGIPLIYIHIEGNEPKAQVRLSVDEFNAGETPYVAISHVWSQGMGNPFENKLPECQLRRLRGWISAYSKGKAIGIWLDTLCVPAEPNGLYRMIPKASNLILGHLGQWFVTPHITSRPQLLHPRVIRRMADIYRSAEAVLVIDRELLFSGPNETELRVRLGRSSWLKRLWTLQEGILAQKILIQCRDEAVTLEDIIYGRNPQDSIASPVRITTFSMTSAAALFNHNFHQHQRRERPRHDQLLVLMLALYQRTTSQSEDEAVCLASMLGLDTEEVLNTSPYKYFRLRKLFSMMKLVPAGLLFTNAPRMVFKGYRWAPQTLLSFPGSHAPIFNNINTTPGLINDYGLCVKCAGFIISPLSKGLKRTEIWTPSTGGVRVACVRRRTLEVQEYIELSEGDQERTNASNESFIAEFRNIRNPALILSGALSYGEDFGLVVSIYSHNDDCYWTKYGKRVWCRFLKPANEEEEAVWKEAARKEDMPLAVRMRDDQKWCVG